MGQLWAILPPLIGVVVGAVGTCFATSFTDQRRWRRNQAVRWDEHRLSAYVEFAARVKDTYNLTCRISAPYRPHSASVHLDWETGLALIAEADRERARSLEKVLILGDEATADAALEWREAVWQLQVYTLSKPANWDEWVPLRDQMDAKRAAFYEAVRMNLNVPRLSKTLAFQLTRDERSTGSQLEPGIT
ncbi:hypothetical protein [Nonomuraea sp. NPDC049709]|uniref:hypothetical protein n=1 Tax=Nonomuraea sp. NPDC049709 TaxID=3154736 RepID=UPI003445699F